MAARPNHLYYGDNLDVLRRYFKDESVDLIYLDPPFNSNATYNVLFGAQDGSRSAAQIKVFEDTWQWDQSSARAYEETVEHGGDISAALRSFRTLLGESNMLAYLSMMAPRLLELRRVLKSTGSIYLHCDPTASHYLKLLMDAVFGAKNFQNEIIWYYSHGGKSKTHFARKHDTLFFYSRSSKYFFNGLAVAEPLTPHKGDKSGKNYGGRMGVDENGREYVEKWGTGRKKLYRYYLDEGKIPEDVWQMQSLQSQDKERLGYPTQKPRVLLERIIGASSKPGDVVLDPFCGCGTTIDAAQRLDRRWIGIDITHLAVNLIRHRLLDTYGDLIDFDVIGEPVTLDDAQSLAEDDPYQFQWWALGLVGARPAEEKKGADKGIDGHLFFHDPPGSGNTQQVVISVKAGHTSSPHLRDLRGVLDREGAAIGVLISMQAPTKAMRTEAASAGFYESTLLRTSHPRIQLLTIADLLAGQRLDLPAGGYGNVTYRQAQAIETPPDHEILELSLDSD